MCIVFLCFNRPTIEPVVANALRGCIEDMKKGWTASGYPIITIATTSEPGRVPTSVLSCFKHEVMFEVCFI
jgi:peroxin-6